MHLSKFTDKIKQFTSSVERKEMISESEHWLYLVTFIAYPQTFVKRNQDLIFLAATDISFNFATDLGRL